MSGTQIGPFTCRANMRCGHAEVIDIRRTSTRGNCINCARLEAAEAISANQRRGLPELRGSERQRLYAEQIRARFWDRAEEIAKSDTEAAQRLKRVALEVRAAFWITRKSSTAEAILAVGGSI